MECPKCSSPVYDNRAKKLSGAFKPNAPDFKCSQKTCDWVQWPPRDTAGPQPSPIQPPPLPSVPSAPQAFATGRDAAIQELFWDSFDAVLAGLSKRKISDLFKPDNIAALTATMFIQRAKG